MYYFVERDDTLAHHGVDGQKWGDRHGPPYPLDRNINKLKDAMHDWAVRRKKVQAQKKRAQTIAKKKKAAKAEERKTAREQKRVERQQKRDARAEAKKKKIYNSLMNSRSDETEIAKKALKYKKLFTTEELNEILKRAEVERKLADVRDAELQRAADRLQLMSKFLGTGIALYNQTTGIRNAHVDNANYKAKGDKHRALITTGKK